MDDTVEFSPSALSSHLHAAPFAGDLQQHHADQWHSPAAVLESTHQDQHTPSPYLSFPSHSSADIHPHQHHHHHTLQAPAMPAIVPLTINGQFNEPLPYTEQQSVPVTTSAVLSPLIQLQLNFFNHQQMMLKLNQDLLTQQMKMIETVYSLHLQKRQQQEATPSSVDYPQVIPTIALPHVASQSNDVDSAVVINHQLQSMDQLIISPSTVVQQQQQQKAHISIASTIAVPIPHGGKAENEIAHSQQSTEVCNSFDDGSLQEVIKIINQRRSFRIDHIIRGFDAPAFFDGITSHEPVRPKYIKHFLDRNGHRMDSPSEQSSASSEVFEWMVNEVRANRRKLRFGVIVLVILIADRIVTVRPSSLFLHPKTVAVVNPSTK